MKEVNPNSEEQKNGTAPLAQSEEAKVVENFSGHAAAHDLFQVNIFADPSECSTQTKPIAPSFYPRQNQIVPHQS